MNHDPLFTLIICTKGRFVWDRDDDNDDCLQSYVGTKYSYNIPPHATTISNPSQIAESVPVVCHDDGELPLR